jgi:hypothetical protein
MSTFLASEKPVPGGKTVKVEFDAGIAWVTLNRPEKRKSHDERRDVADP